jgi:hypothetical protein
MKNQLTWVELSPTSAVQENPLRSVCSHPGAAVTAIPVTITVTMLIICSVIMALAVMATDFEKIYPRIITSHDILMHHCSTNFQ